MYSVVYFNYHLTKYYIMHSCWILLCMSYFILSYVFLLMKEGIGKRKKSKGGLEGSMT
jgi:hypothetical protein